MRTLGFPEVTSVHHSSGDENQPLLQRILKFKVAIICLSFVLGGVLFLVFSTIIQLSPAQELSEQGQHAQVISAGVQGQEIFGHLSRDIGIVLLTTGLVVFAADYMTRKEFIALLGTELKPLREEVETCRDSMLNEMAPLKTDMSSLMSNLAKEITPLSQNIPNVSVALDNIRKCISLGATMSALGIRHIHHDRVESDLRSKLIEAGSQSEIKILGMIAAGVSDPAMEEIIEQKLNDGCKFKILCLDPESRFVRERAAEEDRKPDEMRDDILSKIQGWKNFVQHRVPEDRRSQVELKCHDSTTRYFLFITEKLVVVGFYLGKSRGATSTHLELEIKEGGMATAFIEHFNSLWKGAKGPALPMNHPL
jgi:hypothetical protein